MGKYLFIKNYAHKVMTALKKRVNVTESNLYFFREVGPVYEIPPERTCLDFLLHLGDTEGLYKLMWEQPGHYL